VFSQTRFELCIKGNTEVILSGRVLASVQNFDNFPSLEIFKTCLDAVLCSLLWETLLRQVVGPDDPQRSLPIPTILCFCDKFLIAYQNCLLNSIKSTRKYFGCDLGSDF